MNRFLKNIFLYSFLLLGINIALGYYLSTYETVDLAKKEQFFPKLRWNDYYNFQENIDVLVLGSSHAYRSYDPTVMEQEWSTGDRVFNFGSSAQSPITSYFVLDEALKTHQPKVVVLDLYVMVFAADQSNTNGRINFVAMEMGEGKINLFRKGFSFGQKIQLLLFPSYTYRTYLEYKIKKLLGKPYVKEAKGNYQGNGFISDSDTLSIEKLRTENQFDLFNIELKNITDQNVEYLYKIKARCDQANIPLVLMTAPMPEASINSIVNYTEIFDYFDRIAKDIDIPFYDFNVQRLPEIKDDFHYFDDDHMNATGAEIYSKEVAKMLQTYLMQ